MILLNMYTIADDEQSDCGVSGIIPWWENENAVAPEMETEERLQQIITGSFEHIPRSSQTAFKERISKLMGTVSTQDTLQ